MLLFSRRAKMKNLIHKLSEGNSPFSIIQKQDSEDLLLLRGESLKFRKIKDIPRQHSPTGGKIVYDTISIVPFCQIRERGYTAIDGREEILTIRITDQEEISIDQLLANIQPLKINLCQEVQYDCCEDEYSAIIQKIIDKEIGNGEGANFVIPRNCTGQIETFSTAKALTIFKSLLENDYGTYWKFIFYNGSRFFIGSTPERHLFVKGDKVKMNPISGTFRKDRNWTRSKYFKRDLLAFLKDPKEINELFMVVDEELKMMAKMCESGGSIIGPILKEMSQLIHSEYLLSGESRKDIFDLFTDSMFAATVVGSPVENACNIIAKYTNFSRRYYGSAMLLVGRDEHGEDLLDSPITIRTAEFSPDGTFFLSAGATLVKDSVPKEEVKETKAKSSAILSSIIHPDSSNITFPLLPRFQNDDEIIETMMQRNKSLSHFWFFNQSSTVREPSCNNSTITLIHNEDDFIYMLDHMLKHMGLRTKIVRNHDYEITQDQADLTLLGPGPGNPNQSQTEKIQINLGIAEALLEKQKKSIFICLGHQILCKTLGYELKRKARPLQGSQLEVNLFGTKELVGFYNTFAPQTPRSQPVEEISTIPELDELIAIRAKDFIGFQFHPESLLTQNGYSILQQSIAHLLWDNCRQ